MIGMFLLKHTYALSEEQVWDRWVQDPYFQYFTGEEFFQHVLPHERSGMSHWRKRIGDRLGILLAESLCIAHDTGALRACGLARVIIDTTVQPKNVTFPTDANTAHCLNCGRDYDLDPIREAFLADETLPLCGACGGVVKTATVSFGQSMPKAEMQRAREESGACDLFLANGPSLVVYPAAGFPATRQG